MCYGSGEFHKSTTSELTATERRARRHAAAQATQAAGPACVHSVAESVPQTLVSAVIYEAIKDHISTTS